MRRDTRIYDHDSMNVTHSACQFMKLTKLSFIFFLSLSLFWSGVVTTTIRQRGTTRFASMRYTRESLIKLMPTYYYYYYCYL